MNEPLTHSVTQLLRSWRAGDDTDGDRALEVVYSELRRLARQQLHREGRRHTLESTELVHEAYLRLLGADVPWADRAHFFAVAARTMRRILVDHARAKGRQKRGGGINMVTLNQEAVPADTRGWDILNVDEALKQLGSEDERLEQLIELHFFTGLTYREMADVVGISEATVHRQLRFAKAWLARELAG